MSGAPPLALRLAKLPERAAVRLTITLDRTTHAVLTEYADAYARAYGAEESLGTLIPFMLKQFVESDRAFMRTRSQRSTSSGNSANKGG